MMTVKTRYELFALVLAVSTVYLIQGLILDRGVL
jgi:hypothetical protein